MWAERRSLVGMATVRLTWRAWSPFTLVIAIPRSYSSAPSSGTDIGVGRPVVSTEGTVAAWGRAHST
ncbi:MAG: hypothetical protein BWY79_01307 [Actinobacteria bacterium ADurb.Bin444]|nr:MAG: hypothetical protein BWY79_01307 [Actinobacteria bacterium ADurb.Bin444]